MGVMEPESESPKWESRKVCQLWAPHRHLPQKCYTWGRRMLSQGPHDASHTGRAERHRIAEPRRESATLISTLPLEASVSPSVN